MVHSLFLLIESPSSEIHNSIKANEEGWRYFQSRVNCTVQPFKSLMRIVRKGCHNVLFDIIAPSLSPKVVARSATVYSISVARSLILIYKFETCVWSKVCWWQWWRLSLAKHLMDAGDDISQNYMGKWEGNWGKFLHIS